MSHRAAMAEMIKAQNIALGRSSLGRTLTPKERAEFADGRRPVQRTASQIWHEDVADELGSIAFECSCIADELGKLGDKLEKELRMLDRRHGV